MVDERIIEGIRLCEEILRGIESNELSLMGLLRKTDRFAKLVQKEDEFSWIKAKLEELSLPSGFGMLGRGVVVGTYEYISDQIYDIITKQWLELRFGGVIETIFDENKKIVDSKLIEICPDAVEKFASAYERLRENTPESWAQGVLTCRRILKDFADVIYPPKNILINGRKVGEEEYINRLWAFTSEKIENDTNGELIKSEIEYIGNRIDTLYHLTCKGAHSKITKDEAERAIIQTYLLIGDLIKLGGL
ncbi:MAG: hypothetical protein WC556_01585 [Candidatus Methanoperedens sp.]